VVRGILGSRCGFGGWIEEEEIENREIGIQRLDVRGLGILELIGCA